MTNTIVFEKGNKFLNGELKWIRKSRTYNIPFSEGGGIETEYYLSATETVDVNGLTVIIEHISEKGHQFKRIVAIEQNPVSQIFKDDNDLNYWVGTIFKERIFDVADNIPHFEEMYQRLKAEHNNDVWMIYVQSTGNYEREKYFSKRIYQDFKKYTC